MLEFLWKEEFLDVIDKYKWQKEDLCLVGGVVFSVNGIRHNTDVDFSLRSEVLEKTLYDSGKIKDLKTVRNIIQISKHSDIHVGRFQNIGLSDDELIENPRFHRVIDGFKVCRLEVEFVDRVSFKHQIDRVPSKFESRKNDAILIKNNYHSIRDWDWDMVVDLLLMRERRILAEELKLQARTSEDRGRKLLRKPWRVLRRVING